MDKKNERGAIVIEATISLTTFLFTIITLLTIIDICYVQSKIGVAVNTTAKEISQYTYLYGLTGLNGKQAKLEAQGKASEETINTTMDGISSLYGSITTIAGEGTELVNSGKPSINGIIDSYNTIKSSAGDAEEAYNSVKSEIDGVLNDPKTFFLGCVSMLASEGLDEIKSYIIAPIARKLTEKHILQSEEGDVEATLRHLRVVPNGGSYLKGLDFTSSEFCPDGTEDINIVVEYEVQVIRLLDLDISIKFRQSGKTRAWIGVSSKSEG